MTCLKFPLRIYYEDTDFSGFVYHARYLHFFERGRTEALRALGVDQRAMFEAEAKPSFVVSRMDIAFRAPARMDDVVDVETTITKLGAASMIMVQNLTRNGILLCQANVEIAYLHASKPRKMPTDLRMKLLALTKD